MSNSYAPLIERLSKELEAKRWEKEKKNLLQNNDLPNDNLEDIMEYDIKSVNEYLEASGQISLESLLKLALVLECLERFSSLCKNQEKI